MRRVLRGTALLALIFLCGTTAAEAKPIRTLVASFNVDVGPLTLIVIDFGARFSGADIRSQAEVKTHGITSVFAEYNARAEARGIVDGPHIQPSKFTMARQKREKANLTWSTDGSISMSHPANEDADVQAKIVKASTAETADPVTAILRVATPTGKVPCPSTQRIFDGQDVFELRFTDKGRATLTEGSFYRGPVQRCEVRWHAVAGRAAEKKTPDERYEISFAPLGSLISGQAFWLPVSLTGSIKGLGFAAYATQIAVNGSGFKAPANGNP